MRYSKVYFFLQYLFPVAAYLQPVYTIGVSVVHTAVGVICATWVTPSKMVAVLQAGRALTMLSMRSKFMLQAIYLTCIPYIIRNGVCTFYSKQYKTRCYIIASMDIVCVVLKWDLTSLFTHFASMCVLGVNGMLRLWRCGYFFAMLYMHTIFVVTCIDVVILAMVRAVFSGIAFLALGQSWMLQWYWTMGGGYGGMDWM